MMPAPGIVPGLAFEKDLTNKNAQDLGVRAPTGVFAEHPGATPKYAQNKGLREDNRETMARMFIHVGPAEYRNFVNSVPEESRALASVLADTNAGVGGANGGAGYIDFLLQSWTHGFQEKVETTEVLSDNYVTHFFGQAAPTFSYNAILINSVQDDQALNMLRIYRDMGRGTQLARRGKLIRLRYDGYIVAGTMMNLQMSGNAENEMAVSASWSIQVKSLTLIPNPNSGIVTLSDAFTDLKLPSLLSETGTTRGPVRLGISVAAESGAVDTFLRAAQEMAAAAEKLGTYGKPPTSSTPTSENRAVGSANARATLLSNL